MTDDAVIELDRTLIFGERGGIGGEASNGVVAGLAAADGVRKLATAPVIHLEVSRISEKAVEAAELVVDGRVFECRIEDVDGLILTRHALAILPLVVSAPRWLPEWGEGKFLCRVAADCGSRERSASNHNRHNGLPQVGTSYAKDEAWPCI